MTDSMPSDPASADRGLEALLNIARMAFNTGVNAGMDDFTRSRGGKTWPDVKRKFKQQFVDLLAFRSPSPRVAELEAEVARAQEIVRALLHDLHEHDWPLDETWNAARVFVGQDPLAPLPERGEPISVIEASARIISGNAPHG